MFYIFFYSFHLFFFFNDTATTEIYTLSLHDALPIYSSPGITRAEWHGSANPAGSIDRKSTRLNSSHMSISYAVFCLKKKKNNQKKYDYKKIITLKHKNKNLNK